MTIKLLRILCAAFLSLLASAPAWAMRVSPMVSEISTRGAGSAARIEVQNVGSTGLPFETRVTEISFDDHGQVIESPADDQFLVFPPQGVVPVGGRQVVRAQWVGDPALKASRAFYLAIRQLPVALEASAADKPGAQVQVVYHMKALITVAPPGSQPKVEVVEATPTQVKTAPPEVQMAGGLQNNAPKAATSPTTPGIHVRLRNTGARYALMSGPSWTIEGKDPAGKPLRLKVGADLVAQAVGVGYLAPAGGERVFDVPTGVAFGPGPITIQFSK